ncbi:MAG: helix-turn-helix transcriptional regulator [candidate division WOR-3 bacterium]|nr:helix-turn-helix domain-containing protein [candidate division WOR-3 bacterium]MDW8113440.1 helix-turn-helix transcriptional regulator [candidate division WOR-3 bacterium]
MGNLLRRWRIEKGYSLKEIAQYCKKSESYLAKLERGEVKNPPVLLILNYLKAINKHYGDFFSKIQEYEIENLLKLRKKGEEIVKIKDKKEMKLVREEIRYSLGTKFQKRPFINYPESLELKIKSYLISLGYERQVIERYIRFSEKIFDAFLDGKDENYFLEMKEEARKENLDEVLLMRIAKMTFKDYKRALKRMDQIKPITDRKMKKMIEGYLKYRREWSEVEGRVRKYLYDNNVMTHLFFFYLNKARRYYKLLKKKKIEKIEEVDEKAIKEGLKKEILDGIKEIIKEATKKII